MLVYTNIMDVNTYTQLHIHDKTLALKTHTQTHEAVNLTHNFKEDLLNMG